MVDTVKSNGITSRENPILVKWVFKEKNEPCGIRRYKQGVVTLGYMHIPGVNYTELFSTVATATILWTGIAITLYFDGEDRICKLVDL